MSQRTTLERACPFWCTAPRHPLVHHRRVPLRVNMKAAKRKSVGAGKGKGKPAKKFKPQQKEERDELIVSDEEEELEERRAPVEEDEKDPYEDETPDEKRLRYLTVLTDSLFLPLLCLSAASALCACFATHNPCRYAAQTCQRVPR